MGRERQCRAEWDHRTSTGVLLLETDDLRFRGDRRLKIPLRDVTKATAAKGWLQVVFRGGEARFALGDDAAEWAHRILNPKGRLEKLGLTPTTRLRVTALPDPALHAELEAAGIKTVGAAADVHVLGCGSPAGLSKIDAAAIGLEGTQALWVVYPKGRKDVTEAMVLAAGRAAGLTDVKVIRFSQTHTGLKFVLPKDRR